MGSVTDDTEVDRRRADATGAAGRSAGAAPRVTIRAARPDELPLVGEIRVRAYVAGGFLAPESGYAPRLRALGSGGDGTVLVAVAGNGDGDGDGRVVGTVMLVTHPMTSEIARPDEAEIRALAVAPGTQGMGVGRALLQSVLDRAARQGAHAMVLSTQPEMHAAHRLYEQAGFTRRPDRDWSPEPGVALLVYVLPLPAAAGSA
jgi:ribosomal protein S18 acetylase RimI-like enzyme